VKSTVFLR